MSYCLDALFFCEVTGAPRDLPVLTHSFPTRRSSDLFPFGWAGGAGLDLPDPRNMRAQPDIAGLAVEPFMPILLHIEARQVDRRLHQANPLGARDSRGA